MQDITRRKFAVVILEDDITGASFSPRWTPAMLAALQANYVVKYRDVRFLAVPRPPPSTPPTPLRCTVATGQGGPALIGLFMPGGGTPRLDAGDVQAVSLYWGPMVATPRPGLKISLRLIAPDGGIVWQADIPPGATAGFPWPAWPAGPGPRDDFQVAVPADAVPGTYRLVLAAYAPGPSGLIHLYFECGGMPNGDAVLALPTVAQPLEVP